MRVIAGRFGGRRLRAPAGVGTRPTAERVREALFSFLGPLDGARALDLFAGSGALGIEALSRGARCAVFVERARPALDCLRRNLSDLALGEKEARILRGDARAALRQLAAQGMRFDLVLLDPPYGGGLLAPVLQGLLDHALLAPGARVIVERERRGPALDLPGLSPTATRRYGDTTLTQFEASRPALGPPPGSERDGPGRARVSLDAPAAAGSAFRSIHEPAYKAKRETSSRMTPERPHRIALFPASFDPVTNGHLDIIARARPVFDELVVAVAMNVDKKGGLFTVEERVAMLEQALGNLDGIRITSFNGLLVDYARRIGVRVVLRGLRAMSDFEYEFEMTLMNRHLNPDVETLFMMTSQQFFYVSSSRLKELVQFGAPVGEFVPPLVESRLREKLARP